MRSIIAKLIVSVFVVGLFFPGITNSQVDKSFGMKIENIVTNFKNYRFSTIAIYDLKNVTTLAKIIKDKEAVGAYDGGEEGGGEPPCFTNCNPSTKSIIVSGVKQDKSKNQVARDIISRGDDIPPDYDCIYNYVKSLEETDLIKPVRKGYLLTTRAPRGKTPSTIIALIVSKNDEEEEGMKGVLDNISAKDVYTVDELQNFELKKDSYGAENLYDLMMTALLQGDVKNRTLDAQNIGGFITFYLPKYGISKSIQASNGDIRDFHVQSFMRISEGQAIDYYGKNNELIISPDLISWRRYEEEKFPGDEEFEEELAAEDSADIGDGEEDILGITNNNLPRYGVELKYGIDEINYSSFFSERMSLRALWQNVKLGVVLPTNGWASMSEDVFDQQRRLTFGGAGITAAFDFPFKVIPKSGVFHLNFAYVFGDANEASYKDRNLNYENFGKYSLWDEYFKYDYLIRANAQLHYTFGIAIDQNYLVRFGIGGTYYNTETWTYEQDNVNEKVIYKKFDDESIGGLSGRVEFMSKNIATPYGASLQYFDESVQGVFWLQFPIIPNTFSIRLDAKGYFVAFRGKDDLHPWENESMITPMARFIIVF